MPASLRTPWDIPADWPAPEAAARAVSERLAARIGTDIDAQDGWLPFSRYMSQVLYAPGLGYYSAGAQKFGAAGDFTTAPEISPLFARCVARSWIALQEQIGGGEIVELGAGSGSFAAELLHELTVLDCLPQRYRILEPSADLRERQLHRLQARVPAYIQRVEWLDTPPADNWRGMLFANEVLDALPVSLFEWRDGEVVECGVARDEQCFVWKPRDATPQTAEFVRECASLYGWRGRFRSEFNPLLGAWLRAMTERLQQGAGLFVDYGYARREYYHAERAQGTLLCHYRHRAHADPLILPGLQDITAHVDFTAVAEAAQACDLDLCGYVTQAHFLLDAGIEKLLAAEMQRPSTEYLRSAAQAKTLLLPGEMGERFKCALLCRGVNGPVSGFGGRDLRDRL